MSNTWLILDCNYLCHRARYSMGDLRWEGSATGVIYGFLQTVIHLQERFDTDNIAFCFDSRYSKRKELYPAYKAHRHNQPLTPKEAKSEQEFYQQIVKLRKQYLPEIGFNNVFVQKGYEADDLMASIAQEYSWKHDGRQMILVTADQDLFQCITGHISVYNPQGQIHTTLQSFYQEYKITPLSWIAVKTIAGCPSDNIPGAQGIGEKTALRWVRKELSESSKAFAKIRAWQKTGEAHTTFQLVKLPFYGTVLPEWSEDNISKQGWQNVCRRLGFKTLEFRMPRRR